MYITIQWQIKFFDNSITKKEINIFSDKKKKLCKKQIHLYECSKKTLSIVHAIHCKHISHFRICQSTNTTIQKKSTENVYLISSFVKYLVDDNDQQYTNIRNDDGMQIHFIKKNDNICVCKNIFYIFNNKSPLVG